VLSDAVLEPDPARREAVQRAWTNLTSAGPTLRTWQRLAVIRAARAAWRGELVSPDAPATEAAAHWLAVDAGGLTRTTVEELVGPQMDIWQYLEVVGIVGRLANVDFYARGLGASLPALPEVADEDPTGRRVGMAAVTDGWVPMTQPSRAPFVLDALPEEGDALRDIHEPMYMELAELSNSSFHDTLTRVQIEWIAARSSYLNECFY